MKHEVREERGVSALVVFCQSCRDGQGTHLVRIHNGYGDAAEPITEADLDAANILGHQHERTHPDHEVILYHYTP